MTPEVAGVGDGRPVRGDERLRWNHRALDNLRSMNPRTSTQASTPRRRGFTLIEIMIAVVIVAILAAIALPSFLDSVRKSRRSEAFAALATLQQAQERWRGNTAAYATDAQLTLLPHPAVPSGLGMTRATPNGYYTLLLSGTSAVGYTASATAQGNQANDGTCQLLTVEVAGGNIRYGSGAPPNFGDPGRCWAR